MIPKFVTDTVQEILQEVYEVGVATHADGPADPHQLIEYILARDDNPHRMTTHLHEWMAGIKTDEHGLSMLHKVIFRGIVQAVGEKQNEALQDSTVGSCRCHTKRKVG